MLTECECNPENVPFQCPRHKCVKTQHWYFLCQTRADYFKAWEQGIGPGQSSPQVEADAQQSEEPGLLRKAMNLGKAVSRHIADGVQHVDEETYQHRLTICVSCPSCNTRRMVCQERSCGCRLKIKARWRSQKCPRDNWPSIGPETESSSTASGVISNAVTHHDGTSSDR